MVDAMASGIVGLILTACLLRATNAAAQIPKLSNDGVKGNPGTQSCIRQRFLPSISEVFGRIVDTEFQKVVPPDTTVKLPVTNQGSITIQKMHFVSFTSSKKHFLSFIPTNQTEWTSTGLTYNITGQFRSTLQQLFSSTQTSGTISLAAKNATVTIRTRIRATKQGKQRLEMVSCKANFTNTSISTQASGFFGALSKFFQSVVSSASSLLLERITCNTARYYVESILNDMYANGIPTSIPVSDPTQPRPLLPSELIYNYGLLRDVRVYKNCLGMQEIGEVSWENKSGTPFHPPRLNYSTKRLSDHMLDIWVSDYTFNSLLFHGHNHRVFDTVLDERQTPQWTSNLQSQCPNGPTAQSGFAVGIVECIGNALPELANTNDFPRQTIEMQLKPSNATTAPFVIFRDDLPALLIADFVLDLFANDTKRQRKNVLTADVHLESDIQNVRVVESISAVTARAAKTNATLKIKQDQLFLTPTLKETRSSTLGLFTASFVEKLLNNNLSAGIALPNFKGWKLVKPDAVLLNRTMNIATDVELDQVFWSNAASEARLRVQNKKS